MKFCRFPRQNFTKLAKISILNEFHFIFTALELFKPNLWLFCLFFLLFFFFFLFYARPPCPVVNNCPVFNSRGHAGIEERSAERKKVVALYPKAKFYTEVLARNLPTPFLPKLRLCLESGGGAKRAGGGFTPKIKNYHFFSFFILRII